MVAIVWASASVAAKVPTEKNQPRFVEPTPLVLTGMHLANTSKLPLDPVTSRAIVARVNGAPIFYDRLVSVVRRLRLKTQIDPSSIDAPDQPSTATSPALRSRETNNPGEAALAAALMNPALDLLIEHALVQQELARRGFDVSDDEVFAQIRSINQQRRPGQKLEDEAYAAGRTVEDVRQDVRTELTSARLAELFLRQDARPASTTELQLFLRRPDVRSTTRTEMHARHLIIRCPPGSTTEAQQRAEGRAKDALAAIIGGMTFEEAVRRFSQDRWTKTCGGDLGYFYPETMYPEFTAALQTMEIGATPQIVRTPAGFHVVQLLDRHDSNAQVLYRQDEAARLNRVWKRQAISSAKIERYLK